MQSNFDTFDKNFFDGPGHHLCMSDFDWADVQNKITEYAGYMTGNPQLVATAQATQTVKDTVYDSTGRTLTTAENDKVKETLNQATGEVVAASLTDFFGKIKWIIIGIVLLYVVIKLR